MIVVDIETSGLDARANSIVSIGAIDFANPAHTFYQECRIWEGAQADPESLVVNGFTMEQIIDPAKPSLQEVVTQFMAWAMAIEDRILGGHNTFFDRDFLRVTCERYHLPWDLGHRIIDLHSICWAHMVSHGHPLPYRRGKPALVGDVVMEYAGLPKEPRPHNGLVGATMEAEAFSRILFGKSLLDEFAQYPVPVYLAPQAQAQQALI